jgi:hypothetical protein
VRARGYPNRLRGGSSAARGRLRGPATGEDDRCALIARLLHDDSRELTDRVAGAMLLLHAQQLSRITAMTTDQLTRRGDQVFLRFGRDDLAVPEPLAGLLLALIRDGRRHVGVGSPATTRWLFPGHLPGRPLTASRLGQRLGKLGTHGRSGRRAALLWLASQLPAAVLADPLNLELLRPERGRKLQPDC